LEDLQGIAHQTDSTIRIFNLTLVGNRIATRKSLKSRLNDINFWMLRMISEIERATSERDKLKRTLELDSTKAIRVKAVQDAREALDDDRTLHD
jgi:hypothetical protein